MGSGRLRSPLCPEADIGFPRTTRAFFVIPQNFSGRVTKHLAATGAAVGTYILAGGLNSIAFKGTHIWVTNFGTTAVSVLPAR